MDGKQVGQYTNEEMGPHEKEMERQIKEGWIPDARYRVFHGGVFAGDYAVEIKQRLDSALREVESLRAERDLYFKWRREQSGRADAREHEIQELLPQLEKAEAERDALAGQVAVLREALGRIHKGACLTAQESRSRDDDRYCISDVIQVSSSALTNTAASAEHWMRRVQLEAKIEALSELLTAEPQPRAATRVVIMTRLEALRRELREVE